MKPTRRSAGDPSRLNRVAARRSSLRFSRNTPGPVLPVGAPPSRALSAGPPPGELGLAPTGRTGPRPHRENWPTSALTWVPPPAVHRVAARRSSLRFGRNTPDIPPSRALSAGRLTGLGALTRVPPPATRINASRLVIESSCGRPRCRNGPFATPGARLRPRSGPRPAAPSIYAADFAPRPYSPH